MNPKHLLKITVGMLATILTATALWFILRPADNTPGPDIWVAGRDYMRVIELSASGTYRSYDRCDVCKNGEDAETGRWLESNNKITLVQDVQNTRTVLTKSSYKNCAGLLPDKRPSIGKEPSLGDFYFREGDPCPRAL